MYICIYVNIYTCIMYEHSPLRASRPCGFLTLFINEYVYVYIYIYMYTYICIYIYIYICQNAYEKKGT